MVILFPVQSQSRDYADEIYPDLSPDGETIVYVDPYGMALIDIDGSNQRAVGPDGGYVYLAFWSPDGTHILIRHQYPLSDQPFDDKVDLFLTDRDGTNLVQITDNAVYEQDFRWSPDGTWIGF
jgi:hypothetical protein